jgi:hypothetical protein
LQHPRVQPAFQPAGQDTAQRLAWQHEVWLAFSQQMTSKYGEHWLQQPGLVLLQHWHSWEHAVL